MEKICEVKFIVSIGYGGGGCIVSATGVENHDVLISLEEYGSYLDDFFYHSVPAVPENTGMYEFTGHAMGTPGSDLPHIFHGEFKVIDISELSTASESLKLRITENTKLAFQIVGLQEELESLKGSSVNKNDVLEACDRHWGDDEELENAINQLPQASAGDGCRSLLNSSLSELIRFQAEILLLKVGVEDEALNEDIRISVVKSIDIRNDISGRLQEILKQEQ